MKPRTVRIETNKGYLQLWLPNFFVLSRLEEVYKTVKLLQKHLDKNETAHETLKLFLPEWIAELKAEQEGATRRIQEVQNSDPDFGPWVAENQKRKLKALQLKAENDILRNVNHKIERYTKVLNSYKAIKA